MFFCQEKLSVPQVPVKRLSRQDVNSKVGDNNGGLLMRGLANMATGLANVCQSAPREVALAAIPDALLPGAYGLMPDLRTVPLFCIPLQMPSEAMVDKYGVRTARDMRTRCRAMLMNVLSGVQSGWGVLPEELSAISADSVVTRTDAQRLVGDWSQWSATMLLSSFVNSKSHPGKIPILANIFQRG